MQYMNHLQKLPTRTKQVKRRYVFKFGKHKGQTVLSVLVEDPSYLIWANDNIEWFSLDKEILNDAIDRTFNKKVRRYIDENYSAYYEDDNYDYDGRWGEI